MGIRGLTSYVAKNGLGNRVTHELSWPPKQAEQAEEPVERRALIVDGSALFYHVFFQSADWIHGGNFVKFTAYLRAYIAVLRAVGFDLTVLVDGGVPEGKMETMYSREAEKVKRVMKAQRAILANDGSYRNMDGFMPQLAYQAAMSVLREEGVEYRVCWTEADGLIANLAKQRNGLVLSKDSDFFIFNSPGYMPLYDVEIPKPLLHLYWGAEIDPEQVFHVKTVVYMPEEVAKFMEFDVSFLPLMAALTGNDYDQALHIVDEYLAKHVLPPNSALTPHDRIREVATLLKQQTDVDASTLAAAEALAELLAGEVPSSEPTNAVESEVAKLSMAESEEEEPAVVAESAASIASRQRQAKRTDIMDAITGSLQHYALREFDDFDQHANTHLFHDKLATDADKAVVRAFERGCLPYQFANVLTSNRYFCYIRLSMMDAQTPSLPLRAVRLFIYQQLASTCPALLSSPAVEELLRRGYNFKAESVAYDHETLSSMHKAYESLPKESVVHANQGDRLRAFCILTGVSESLLEGTSPQDLSLVAALRLMMRSCHLGRSAASPKLADFELAALIISTLYVDEGAVILKPPVGPNGKTPIKRIKTSYSLRGVLRAAQWQCSLEHVWALAQVLRLDAVADGQWVAEGDGLLDLSRLAVAYHGPLFHNLIERFKGGTNAVSMLQSVGLDSKPYEQLYAAVVGDAEEELDKVFVEKKRRSKKPSSEIQDTKPQLKTQNLFDLLNEE